MASIAGSCSESKSISKRDAENDRGHSGISLVILVVLKPHSWMLGGMLMTIGMYVRKRTHSDCRQSSYRRLDCFRTAFRAYRSFRRSTTPFYDPQICNACNTSWRTIARRRSCACHCIVLKIIRWSTRVLAKLLDPGMHA